MRAAFIRLKDEGGVYLRAASISGTTVIELDNSAVNRAASSHYEQFAVFVCCSATWESLSIFF